LPAPGGDPNDWALTGPRGWDLTRKMGNRLDADKDGVACEKK
jgi:hypothetical protein